MDYTQYLAKANKVLFLDDSNCPGADLDKCKDLTSLYLLEGEEKLLQNVASLPDKSATWIYLQKDLIEPLTLKKVAYFCDGQVEFFNKNSGCIENKWWFKTSSTKVVYSEQPKLSISSQNRPGELEVLTEKHGREKDKVDLQFGSASQVMAGFDSDDPDADLDL